MVDISIDHGNDMMVAQFVFLFLMCMFFLENSTGMDIKNCQYLIAENKSTTIFHCIFLTIEVKTTGLQLMAPMA